MYWDDGAPREEGAGRAARTVRDEGAARHGGGRTARREGGVEDQGMKEEVWSRRGEGTRAELATQKAKELRRESEAKEMRKSVRTEM
jgi:hypothetical protein